MKLTRADVADIKASYQRGDTMAVIAARKDVAPATVSRVLANKQRVKINLLSAGQSLHLRLSAQHWADLTRLLGRLERCVAARMQLDASRQSEARVPSDYALFQQRLNDLKRRMAAEVTHVTAERLGDELARQQATARQTYRRTQRGLTAELQQTG